ncbi:MAG: hypothetical protein RL023_266 [Candidatus Parcubacteria bacterium]|jgi:hypothetical protein
MIATVDTYQALDEQKLNSEISKELNECQAGIEQHLLDKEIAEYKGSPYKKGEYKDQTAQLNKEQKDLFKDNDALEEKHLSELNVMHEQIEKMVLETGDADVNILKTKLKNQTLEVLDALKAYKAATTKPEQEVALKKFNQEKQESVDVL